MINHHTIFRLLFRMTERFKQHCYYKNCLFYNCKSCDKCFQSLHPWRWNTWIKVPHFSNKWFPGGSDGKECACNAGDPGAIPGMGRSIWGRKWQPTPVFLPGEFHGQRKLVGYSPLGRKESDTTEWLTHTHTHTHTSLWNGIKYSTDFSGVH